MKDSRPVIDRPQLENDRLLPDRVVHVTARFAPFVGGLEKVVAAHAAELVRQGVSVEILTTRVGSRGYPANEDRDGVLVRRFRSLTLSGASLSIGLFVALLRQPAGTVVHVHVPHAGLAEIVRLTCRLRRRPYVLHFHLDVDASSWLGRLLPAYKRWLLGPVVRSACCVVALTGEMAEFLVRSYNAAPDRVVVLPNGVDGRVFRPEGPGRPKCQETGSFRLLVLGRLSRQKNIPRLLRAIAAVEGPVELVLVGEGSSRRDLEDLAARLGVPAQFVGETDAAGVVDWLRWADALVSSSDREGMPLALLEAMAVGIPVLCTDVPGSRDVVGDAGLVVSATEAALARGVEMLRGDALLRADLGRRGRERAARHSWPALSRELVGHYARLGAQS
jgi:glycosyltransferase involved in cell wall biosynthesis